MMEEEEEETLFDQATFYDECDLGDEICDDDKTSLLSSNKVRTFVLVIYVLNLDSC